MQEFRKYFEKLIEMFASIGDVLPRFQIYEKLFGNHVRLVESLSVVYLDIMRFCIDAKRIFRRSSARKCDFLLTEKVLHCCSYTH